MTVKYSFLKNEFKLSDQVRDLAFHQFKRSKWSIGPISYRAFVSCVIVFSGAADCLSNDRIAACSDGASLTSIKKTINSHDLSVDSSGFTFKPALKMKKNIDMDLTRIFKAESVRGITEHSSALKLSIKELIQNNSGSASKMQKIHYHILRNKLFDNGIMNEDTLFIGFAFEVEEYEVSGGKTIVAQAWQGAPHAPPLALILDPDTQGNLLLSVQMRNNLTGSNPSALPIKLSQTITIDRKSWYSVILKLSPTSKNELLSTNNSFELYMKSNSDNSKYQRKIWTNIPWGYFGGGLKCPYASHCDVAKPNGKLDFTVGLYRKESNHPISVLFDQLRISTIFDQADPERQCMSR